MKKIVVAPDSFKGNLSASEVSEHLEIGLKRACNCEVIKIPMSDGGEGTSEVVTKALDGEFIDVTVKNPLYRDVRATYGIANGVAIMEMAMASGINLIERSERNALKTTTYGTGEMILDSLKRGCKKIIIGIGGSATNDGGAGMAAALGVRFTDKDGNEVFPSGGELNKIENIDISGITPLLSGVEISVACDVTNTLCGTEGASFVFGGQKGASDSDKILLDNNLMHYAKKIKECLDIDVLSIPGGGGAGGLGAGLVAFCGATLSPGFELISNAVNLKDKLKGADLVITGEGRTDFQTAFGKLPGGVCSVAKSLNIPSIIISGAVEGDITPLYDCGATAVFAAVTSVTTLDEALENGAQNVERAAENAARLFFANKK